MTDILERTFEQVESRLRDQAELASETPVYQQKYGPGREVDASSLRAFQELPLSTSADILAEFEDSEGKRAFYSEASHQLFLSPFGDELVPLYYSDADWKLLTESLGDMFNEAGIGAGDLVLNCMSYNVYPAGLLMHGIITAAGATPVPVGTGNTEQTAAIAEQLNVDGVLAFPSFAEKIAAQADLNIDVFIGGGEPIVNYPERREELRDLMGGSATVVDSYGVAEIGLIAVECEHENGMHINDEYVFAEVVDPGTGAPVEEGEAGELVLTHLQKDMMPLVRYRTGDVTVMEESDCPCGADITLPKGIFGRTDNRLKIKGVKVYPGSVETVVSQFDGLTGKLRMHITKPAGETDHLELRCEGTAADVDVEELREVLAEEMMITPDELVVVSGWEEGEQVVDERTESIT